MSETLYLIDGSNLIFRAYHAMPPMSSSQGMPTHALFGFINMLLRLEDAYHPTHLAVVFDAGGQSTRANLFEQYKSHRPPCPEDLTVQMNAIKPLLRSMGYQVIDAVDVEADDVIATWVKRCEQMSLPVVIVTSDKDLMQLCNHQVSVLDTMKNGNAGFVYGPKEVREKFGVSPSQLRDVLALMGDTSDNVPGVPGIGPKTAAQLINQFGSLAEVLQNIDRIEGRGADRLKELMRTHQQQALLSYQLVTLHQDVPILLEFEDLRKKSIQTETLKTLLSTYQLNRLLRRFFPKEVEENVHEPKTFSETEVHMDKTSLSVSFPIQNTDVVTTASELQNHIQSWGNLSDIHVGISFQFTGCESSPPARTQNLCGLALYTKKKTLGVTQLLKPIYLPLRHLYLGVTRQWEDNSWVHLIKPLLESKEVSKMVCGSKEAHLVFGSLGVALQGISSDPSLCSYLLDASQRHGLWTLLERHATPVGVLPKNKEQLCQTGKHKTPLETIEIEKVAQLAGFEAQAIVELGVFLHDRLDAASLQLLKTMEVPLAEVLASMEEYGVKIDPLLLQSLSEELSQTLRTLEAEVAQLAGYEVNINSPKQLQELLFEKLKLPVGKKTKTGFSTDAEVLEILAQDYPIAHMIHTHRNLSKLKNTYLDQLPNLIDPNTGRVHTSYNQVVAATGRLSSSDPNLQNIPIRTDLGKKVRHAFIAPKNRILISADYSQIELRVLAHLSQDPLLLESFLQNQDIHIRTAIEMFGLQEGAKPEMRRVAKMINYGIVYGLTDHGLATRLSIPRSTAKQYIQDYFKRYKGISGFMDMLLQKARQEGGARTVLGRFRPLPDLSASNYQVRAYAERMAKNTPIQGSAADILKRAMIDVQQALQKEPAWQARMILTVHDELIIEADVSFQDQVAGCIKQHMEHALTLSVPLQVDIGMGQNWADCK